MFDLAHKLLLCLWLTSSDYGDAVNTQSLAVYNERQLCVCVVCRSSLAGYRLQPSSTTFPTSPYPPPLAASPLSPFAASPGLLAAAAAAVSSSSSPSSSPALTVRSPAKHSHHVTHHRQQFHHHHQQHVDCSPVRTSRSANTGLYNSLPAGLADSPRYGQTPSLSLSLCVCVYVLLVTSVCQFHCWSKFSWLWRPDQGVVAWSESWR